VYVHIEIYLYEYVYLYIHTMIELLNINTVNERVSIYCTNKACNLKTLLNYPNAQQVPYRV
jgi:hypothetical protein